MADKNGYIGRSPGDSSVTIARQVNTVSGVQTTFTFSSGYDVGYLDVYLNGTKLINAIDYTATDTGTVTFSAPAQAGDVIEFVAYKAFNLGQTVIETSGNLDVLGDLTASDIDSTGNITATGSISGDGSTLSGVVTSITAGDNISVNQSTGSVTISVTDDVVADSLVISGISTLGEVQGISGVSTTFVSAVGIQSGGTTIGVGITQLNFIGVGNTFKVDGTSVDISIESGGGAGLSTNGISTGFIFSNPNTITESIDLTQADHNYGMFGPITVSVGATVVVGSGNTFTIV